MSPLWVVIDSRCDETRILATCGPTETVLKARLSATAQHPRALPTLLEALAMWQGTAIRAVVVVDDQDGSCVTRLKLDFGADFEGAPLYKLEYVPRRRPHHRDRLDGMGVFHDLRQLALFEAAR